MMIESKWFCMPDDDREPWCFLTLELDAGKRITGWQAGYGNPRRITRMLGGNESSEEEIIQRLLRLFEEIRFCRRMGTTLITLGAEDLPALRTRTLLLGLDGAVLRGLKHICIERLLRDHFLGFEGGVDLPHARSILKSAESAHVETDGLKEPEVLWRLFLEVGSLLPKVCFRGPPP